MSVVNESTTYLRGLEVAELKEEDMPMVYPLLVLCFKTFGTKVISFTGTPARSPCSFIVSSESAL